MSALTNLGANVPTTMTSHEIGELTGKRHDHILRDVEKLLADLGQTSPQFWGELPDAYGRAQRVAVLPKRETLILAPAKDRAKAGSYAPYFALDGRGGNRPV